MRQSDEMKICCGPLSWPFPRFAWAALVFFLCFFAYVWFRLEPSIEYASASPLFFLNGSFLTPFLTRPGGLLEYGAAFLAQLNYYDWLGAVAFTALGCLAFFAAGQVLSMAGGVGPVTVEFGLPFLLLLLRARYDSHALGAALGLVLALAVTVTYVRSPLQCRWLRLAACWALDLVLGWIAGLWPGLLFLVLCGWFEGRRRNWLGVVGCLPPAVALSFGMISLSGPPPAQALNPWGSGVSLVLAAALFLYVPGVLALVALFPGNVVPRETEARPGRRAAAAKPARRRVNPESLKRAFAAGFLLAGCVAVWWVLDGSAKALAEIEHYAGRKEYDKVLAAAGRARKMTAAAQVRIDLALARAGRLTQDMFAFSSQRAWDLLPGPEGGLAALRPQSETLFALGQVNDAEHLAHEALEIEGMRPDLLRLLAQINVAKDRPRAARVFLNQLGQIPFQRAWAQGMLRDLEAAPALPGNQDLTLIRSCMPTTDLPHDGLPMETFCLQLLKTNPRNQLAFEYLMAHYLLNRDTDQVLKHLGRMDQLSYTAIPRHIEEAILLHQKLKNTQVDLRGREVRAATRERFQRFVEAIGRHAYQTQEGRDALTREFGDTFWYHYYTRPGN